MIHSVSIIGAGNVAYGLGMALVPHFHIDMICSRTMSKARELGKKLKALAVDDLTDTLKSDMVIIAVDDDAIEGVAEKFSTIAAPGINTLITHTSGSIERGVLDRTGLSNGVLYPLQTFTYGRKISLVKVPFLINGSSITAVSRIRKFAETISERVFEFSDEDRKKVHLPAVFINNFVNHLLFKSEELLKDHGLEMELFLPLLEETVKKARKFGAFQAQSGPAKRKDFSVLYRHMEDLKGKPGLLEMYALFTDSILKTYHADFRRDKTSDL